MTAGDDIDLSPDSFHACALRAWIEVAEATGRWPPDSEATRRLAYQLYETGLRQRNAERDDHEQLQCHAPTSR